MNCYSIDEDMVKSFLPARKHNSHKGIYGHVLNIAGSDEYRGAACLSSLGAYKAGCGMVTLAACKNVINTCSIYNPMIIYLPLMDSNNFFSKFYNLNKIVKLINNYNVICLGCGVGTNRSSIYLVKNLLKALETSHIPVVIDADALNIIALEKINILPENAIITPHPKELSRLLNKSVEDIQKNRVQSAIEASRKYKCITVLKGENTVISNKLGEEIFINTSGNSALSKAGSGDVLSGMLSGFIAQIVNDFQNIDSINEKLIEAAIISVYLHGKAAEEAAADLTEYSAMQNDIINSIGYQIKKLI